LRPAHGANETFSQFMLAAAETTPAAPAVIDFGSDSTIRITSYEQLEYKVRRDAEQLADLQLGVADRVVVEADTSANSIAACLACSAVGLTFIPISPQAPRQRLLSIIESASPKLFLQAERSTLDGIEDHCGTGVFDDSGIALSSPPERTRVRYQELATTDAAYIIFTSGSTGRPKGVVMSHRAVVSFYHGMLHYRFVGPGDRVASTSSMHFDFAWIDIGLALGSGAAVIPVPRPMLTWPKNFARVLRETEATQVNGVPSIWRSMLQHHPQELQALPTVRTVLYAGEPFPLPELRRFQRLLPGVRIINCYGATESMACSFADVPDPLPPDLDQPSIGTAHPGAEIILLDSSGDVIDRPGVIGEIHLRSPALFTAYWDDPEATRRALVPDPIEPRSGSVVLRSGDLARRGLDGEYYLCGRVDTQVKIQGNRVELSEVERRLVQHPGVRTAAALAIRRPDNNLALVAVVVADQANVDSVDLASFCRQNLPPYMVPTQVVFVDELPVNANGKLDRVNLAATVMAQNTLP
jgi:amino acid adenylation domain-containing protein